MPSSSRYTRPSLRLLLLLLSLSVASIQATAQPHQDTASAPGCTLHQGIYTCNWQAFRSAFDAAHTVTIETQPMDRFTAAQLRHLARDLGKTVVPAGQPADLTFLLIPMENNSGIDFGPGPEPLATLRIYAPGPETSRGTLLWAETLTGQRDRPWPSDVHAVIEQFRDRFHQH